MELNMQINELFKNIEARIPATVKKKTVRELHYGSRKIEAGHLFVAVRGFKTDGHRYLADVEKRGALAAVVEEVNPQIKLPQVVVSDCRRVMAHLAANFYAGPLAGLKLVGITGTNGKTTTSYLVQSVLNAAGKKAGLIGTIVYDLGKSEPQPAWNTTPEAVDICRMLARMTENNCQSAVLEVSSHGLALNRVDGLSFDGAVFMNLSRDHLDFHPDEQAYFQAKARLFDLLKQDGVAALNIDDPYGQQLAGQVRGKILSFGLSEHADVRATEWETDVSGIRLTMITPTGALSLSSGLIGAFNVQNILAATAVALGLGIETDKIIEGIEALTGVPGRLEAVDIRPGVLAVIDYAHTPDALEKAIRNLRKIASGRLIVLFGAGGDRDKGKRPLMGKIVDELADVALVTSDNPRTEKPEAIIEEICSGMAHAEKRRVITERRKAIETAVQMAAEGDVILIAGKGHESYQEIDGVKKDFDEKAILKEAALKC